MELSKEELREAVGSALEPLKISMEIQFRFMGDKMSELKQTQDKTYSRDVVDDKLANLKKEVSDLKDAVKNIWPQALAACGGLWIVLQVIAWFVAHAPK